MKRVLRFMISFLMATTIFTVKAKADDDVDITFVVGEATLPGKSGTFTVTVPYDKPLRSILFTAEGSDEVCPDDPSVGLWTWSPGTDGISDFTPEELLEFCPKYDVTLYAAYRSKHTVTFDLQGGSYQGSKTCTYTVIQGRRYSFSDITPDKQINVTSNTTCTVGNIAFLNEQVFPGEMYDLCTFHASSSDSSVVRCRHEHGDIYIDARSTGTARVPLYADTPDGQTIWDTRTFTVYADDDPAVCAVFGFCRYRGKQYWYEDGVRQGIMGDPKNITDTVYGYERGREIYDPESDAWYWLDAIYDGAKAAAKEVWMPYIFQSDLEAGINKQGKWVRYNRAGAMIKGWYTVGGSDIELYPSQTGNRYYYDRITGEMVKGYREIDGKLYHFDENIGVLQN